MDFRFLYHRIKYIITDPDRAWDLIYSENRPLKCVRNSILLPLILLVSVSAFLGSYLFIHPGFAILYSVLAAIRYFILFGIVIYVSGFVLNILAGKLKIDNDFTSAYKIILYSSAPFILCQIICRLFESLIFINILALYGTYIFWTGSGKMLNPSEDKKILLLVVSFIVFSALYIITNLLLTTGMEKLFIKISG